MKAASYDHFGSTGNIRVGMLPLPGIGEGEVLIQIRAAGVNPVDAAVLHGYLKDHVPHSFPVIPGWDMAGVVVERGFSARRFKAGDEVYAYARRPVIQYGTFAQYIILPESYLALKPKKLSWMEAGGIPLAGLTAYQSLFDAGHLEKGQVVMILGASGGVGSMAIQLAKSAEATVIAVASEKNHDYMKELGAAMTVDYHNPGMIQQVRERFKGVDLIFDCISGETLTKCLPLLKPSGMLVSILNRGTELDRSIRFQYVFVEPDATELMHLSELADKGQLRVHISRQYSLEETAKALDEIQTHHTTGKLIIIPDQKQ